MSKTTTIDSAARVEEILATCPPAKRDSFVTTARRVVNGPRQRQAAIRIKCLECCCWQKAEVTRCEIRGCALWALR